MSLVVLASETYHCGDLMKIICSEFNGRGGGSKNFAEGSIPDEVNNDLVLDYVNKLLEVNK